MTKSRSNIVGQGPLGQALRTYINAEDPIVFFCVKAFDLSKAILEAHKVWEPNVPFITLSNGFLPLALSSLYPDLTGRPLRAGMTTMGATLDQDGVLKIYDEGAVMSWGNMPHASENIPRTPIEQEVLSAHDRWSWRENMNEELQKKWVFNATLNTLCGALRLKTNGNLINHKSLADEVFNESVKLAEELWPDLPSLSGEREVLKKNFWQLVERTSKNENSMMRDVRLGRRTESLFLAGQAVGRRGYEKLKMYHAVLARLGT